MRSVVSPAAMAACSSRPTELLTVMPGRVKLSTPAIPKAASSVLKTTTPPALAVIAFSYFSAKEISPREMSA